MARKKRSPLSIFFHSFSNKVTKITGKPGAFLMAILVIIIWGITGPIFGFSDTWQLVINTGTTIITFLMVFVIQHSQNKDTLAIQLKLNELIAASCDASNRVVAIEDLTEEELDIIKKFYTHLARTAKNESDVYATHSLNEAQRNTTSKSKSKSEKK